MQILKAIFMLSIITALAACQQDKYPQAPTNVISPTAKQTDYKLGPLDQIEIFVWRSPELSTKVAIRPDGRISIPLVEDIQAAGKTPTQLSREIEKLLSTYVQDPIVNVIVNNFAGAYEQQVRIIGQSEKPMAIPYRSGMRVLDAMIAVGGLRPFAAGNAATLIRTDNGVQKQYSLRLDDLISKGDISANVPILPGDVITIPESQF